MKPLNTLLAVLTVFLLTASSLSAQYVTIGAASGAAPLSNQDPGPVNIFWRTNHYQTIYTVPELQAAGFASGATIQEIGWNIVGAPLYALPGYTISMGHTSNNTSSVANYVSTGLTQVYNNANYAPPAGGFDMLPLSSPFLWNGSQSIVIDICYGQVVPTYDQSGETMMFNATDGASFIRNDGAASLCASPTTGVRQEKPVVQFLILNGVAPSCSMVNNDLAASNISDVSADLSWTHPGTPVEYLVEYGPQGFSAGTGTMVTPNPTTSPVSLSNLSTATDYSVRVQAICGTAVGDTSFARIVNFSTTCASFNTAPVTESFEGASVDCLNSTNGFLTTGVGWGDVGWYLTTGSFVSAPSAFEGNEYITFSTSNTTAGVTDTLFMIPVDLSGLTNPFLDFAYYLEGNFNGATSGFSVEVGSNGTWTSVFSVTTAQGPNWKFAAIDLSTYAGQTIEVRIIGTASASDTGEPGIDRLRIKEAPIAACAAIMAPDTTGFEDAGLLNPCWEQADLTIDNLDWSIGSDTTGTPNTGPSGAHDGTYYAYLESSAPVMAGDSAMLISPPINTANLPDAPALYFNYHMYGNDLARLRVEYEIFGSDVWIPLWESMGGTQDAETDPYLAAYVPIPAAANSVMRVRFIAVAGPGNTWASDIAIDGIRVQNVLADDAAVTNIITPDNACGLGTTPITIEVANRGFNTQGNIPIFVSVNGGTPVGASISGPIPGNNGVATIDVLIDMTNLGHYDITAYTALAMDEVPTNDMMMATAYHQPNITPDYSEEFEGTDGYWYAEGDWEHGMPTGTTISGAAAGSEAFVTNLSGNYSHDQMSYLYSPCFDLSSMTSPFLRFSINWEFEDDNDGAWLEYSVSGGPWTKLGTNNNSGQGWYNNDVPNNNIGWAWSGTGSESSNGWIDAIIDLSVFGFITSETRFRFVVSSDATNGNEGLGIDNFGIFEGPCIDVVLNETVTDESTPNTADGSIVLNPVGGFGNYTYLWSDGSTSNGISGLVPGTYDVTVTHTALTTCTTTGSFTIGTTCPSNLGISTIATPTIGEGTSDGAAQITATGGLAPYTYAWDNGLTDGYAFNLSAGNYMVTVTDANGCSEVMTIVIETIYMTSTDNIASLRGLNISPNPAKDYTQLNIAFEESVDLTVRIADVTGRVLE
ncbi:MAG: fibronectin type III domain-containing protein, partial [Saprospiraceae bacterium]